MAIRLWLLAIYVFYCSRIACKGWSHFENQDLLVGATAHGPRHMEYRFGAIDEVAGIQIKSRLEDVLSSNQSKDHFFSPVRN